MQAAVVRATPPQRVGGGRTHSSGVAMNARTSAPYRVGSCDRVRAVLRYKVSSARYAVTSFKVTRSAAPTRTMRPSASIAVVGRSAGPRELVLTGGSPGCDRRWRAVL